MTIQEAGHSLHIQVTQESELWQRLAIAAVPGAILGIAATMLLSSFWGIAIAPFVALGTFALAKDGESQLTVSQFEFVAEGDLGRRTRRRVVMAADVRGLEFQVGPALSTANEGLYVRIDRSNLLILPNVDWNQAQEVIEAIKKRLPGLSENWS